MKRFLNVLLVLTMAVAAGVFFQARAVESWTQTLMATLDTGAIAKGAGVLQVGQVSTLSAVIADTTAIEVVAAPSAGSTYVRGIWVEKSTTDTGSVTLTYGTETTDPCDTDTATLLSLTAATGQTLKFGYTPLGIQVPAKKQLCAATDAATTVVRVLTQ